MEQIVFFTYEDGDFGFYQRLLSEYFPTLDNRSVTTHSMKYKNDDPSIDSTTTNCHVLVSTGKSDETNHANLNETCVATTLIIENIPSISTSTQTLTSVELESSVVEHAGPLRYSSLRQ